MSVRAIQARINCDRQTLLDLWRTHCVFNQRLPSILSVLFKMRRGECGDSPELQDLYQRISRFIIASSSQLADALLNSVSIRNWKPDSARKRKIKVVSETGEIVEVTGETWADAAAAISKQGQLLYDKRALLFDLPNSMRQIVSREAVTIISGHDELTAIWHKEHAAWSKQKAEWQNGAENQRYLALRPKFAAFEEEVGGAITKRRGRWHLYLQWLPEHPELAAWRGGPAIVRKLDHAALLRVQRSRPSKQRTVEAEEFWKINPELKVLDRLHGDYESRFVRRRKTKKNSDGFDHRPTFTLPHPVNHPRWFVFNAPQTSPQGYGDLKLPAEPNGFGTISLRLLTGEKSEGGYPSNWRTVRFKADPRLADFRQVSVKYRTNKGASKGTEREKRGYIFVDRQLKLERKATISGAKLVFRDIRLNPDGSLSSATPYLIFTCNIDDELMTERAKAIKWSDTGEITKKGKPRKKKTLPSSLVSCAIDLGHRHLGFATIAQAEETGLRILRSRNLWIGHKETTGHHPGRWCEGPDLAHLGQHKRKLRALRRLRGKPVKDERTHVELQGHIDDMAEDRFKKGARAIINFALNTDNRIDEKTGKPIPRADVLLLENLENLIPDAERERGINRMLVQFNRGNLVKRVKEMAADAGLKVFEVSPFGTSQVCSKCGELGRRYSIRRQQVPEDPTQTRPDIHFGLVEKLFACPKCNYRANADHNASVNLHRRFHNDGLALKSFAEFRALSDQDRLRSIEQIDAKLLEPLRELHNVGPVTPF